MIALDLSLFNGYLCMINQIDDEKFLGFASLFVFNAHSGIFPGSGYTDRP